MYSIMGDTPKAARKSRKYRPARGRDLARAMMGHDFAAPVGPHGRVILKVTPDKVNTPRLLGR